MLKEQENCPVFIRLSQKTRQNNMINTVFLNKRCRNSQKIVKMCCPLLTTRLSGSPIFQNGKLVGALTHVLVASPTEGYGILSRICWARVRQRYPFPLGTMIPYIFRAYPKARRECLRRSTRNPVKNKMMLIKKTGIMKRQYLALRYCLFV